jgi:hypothetical protein
MPVALEDAHLDRSGCGALQRVDRRGPPLERQLDVLGGLHRPFEEHVPTGTAGRPGSDVHRDGQGLESRPDHTFNRSEHNTCACPWHHPLTAVMCSFRVAKALRRNPRSQFDIRPFRSHESAPFAWHSQQLLDLGLMEPAQWF